MKVAEPLVPERLPKFWTNYKALVTDVSEGFLLWVCSSAGRAAVSKAAGRGFESLRTRDVKPAKQVR